MNRFLCLLCLLCLLLPACNTVEGDDDDDAITFDREWEAELAEGDCIGRSDGYLPLINGMQPMIVVPVETPAAPYRVDALGAGLFTRVGAVSSGGNSVDCASDVALEISFFTSRDDPSSETANAGQVPSFDVLARAVLQGDVSPPDSDRMYWVDLDEPVQIDTDDQLWIIVERLTDVEQDIACLTSCSAIDQDLSWFWNRSSGEWDGPAAAGNGFDAEVRARIAY